MEKRRVVVTGMGALTPIGNDVKSFWDNVKKGVCGIAPITYYDTTDRKVTLAAELKDFDAKEYLDKKECRRTDKFTQYAMIAAKQAMEDADFDLDKLDKNRAGVIISSGIGGLETTHIEDGKGREKGYDRLSPLYIPMTIPNMAAAKVAIEYGFHGMCTCVVTACAGGTNAIGDAFRHIRDGYADVMLAGGAEACINTLGIGGFTSMQALNTGKDPNRASIPFDKERHGFVMGEGSGVLVLEEYEHAVERNADIYGEIVGYGANCDAYHMTAPLEDGSMAAECMKQAVADADISMEDIDYINAHGTSTALNDAGETKAVRLAFGDAKAEKLMMSSTKSMTGHLLGAAGAIESIVSIMSLKDGFVPATINYKVPDEECDLDIVPNEGRKAQLNYVMSNTLGFGGHNAVLVFKKA